MKVNNKDLVAVSKKSATAERIIRMIGERRRNTIYTAFSGLRADLKKRDRKAVDREEFDDTFRDLESIGAGKLELSPRGVFQGFHWSIPLRELASMLKNKPSVQKAVAQAVLAKTKKAIAVENHKAIASDLKKAVTVVILRKNQEPETVKIPEKRLRELDL